MKYGHPDTSGPASVGPGIGGEDDLGYRTEENGVCLSVHKLSGKRCGRPPSPVDLDIDGQRCGNWRIGTKRDMILVVSPT